MHKLEDWICNLLDKDIHILNTQYSSRLAAQQEVDTLLGRKVIDYKSHYVGFQIIQGLHEKIRCQECEAAIWSAVIFRLADTLPVTIASDLIDRNVIVTELGHTRQSDEIQARLAHLVDEALLTLFWEMYTLPKYSVRSFTELLAHFPDHEWLLSKWKDWHKVTQSVEKQIEFHRWAWRHPKRPENLPEPAQYLAEIEDQKRQMNEWEDEAKQAAQERKINLELEAEAKHIQLERIANEMLSDEEIYSILTAQEFEMLMALANNHLVAPRWIQELANCYGIKGARQIREIASKNLKFRQIYSSSS